MHFPKTEEDTEMTDPTREGDKNLRAILESNLKQMDAMAELVAKQGSALDEMTKHLTTIDKSFGEDYPRERRNQTRPRRERETGNPPETTNPPSYFQRREGRTPGGTSPQIRRLDGSHRDKHRT